MSFAHEDKDWIHAEIATLRDSIERFETSLLTEFHKGSSPLETRLEPKH
jgi:hypothetical protein